MGEIELLGDLTEVREGLARLLIPKVHTIKGPGKVGGAPFYNRTMAFPRHLSVLVLEALGSKVRKVLDGLSSTGVLGIRLALEVERGLEVTLNDRRGDAFDLMKRNMEINGVRGTRLLCEDLNPLLHREHFDYVDVDPFGSPIPFLDSSLRSVRPRGYLAITATDTAVLAGRYPRTCLRRYGATTVRAPFSHELGVRILVGTMVRWAARYDLAVLPLLALWREHYYKMFVEVSSGALKAEAALGLVGRAEYIPERMLDISPGGNLGPLWTGPLQETELLDEIRSRDYMPAVLDRYLEVWREESQAPPLFYTTDELASSFHIPAPPLRKVLETLQEAGFSASRTTFHPKGFKTGAAWEELGRLFGQRRSPH